MGLNSIANPLNPASPLHKHYFPGDHTEVYQTLLVLIITVAFAAWGIYIIQRSNK